MSVKIRIFERQIKKLTADIECLEKIHEDEPKAKTYSELYEEWLNKDWLPYCEQLRIDRQSIVIDESCICQCWKNGVLHYANDTRGGHITNKGNFTKLASTFHLGRFDYFPREDREGPVGETCTHNKAHKYHPLALTPHDPLEYDPWTIWSVAHAWGDANLAEHLVIEWAPDNANLLETLRGYQDDGPTKRDLRPTLLLHLPGYRFWTKILNDRYDDIRI
jgi:hypothetical protein